MHRTIKPHPHHLGDAAGIVAVGLINLCLQHRFHMPRLDTNHRQAGFGESTEQPLRQRSGFQPDPLEAGPLSQWLESHTKTPWKMPGKRDCRPGDEARRIAAVALKCTSCRSTPMSED